MIPQYTAAALCNRNKTLANPSSTDTIPTSANQEDHVSMGANSARKLIEINDNLEGITAIEFLLGCQGMEFLERKVAPAADELRKEYRKIITKLEKDRPSYDDIEKTISWMRADSMQKKALGMFQRA